MCDSKGRFIKGNIEPNRNKFPKGNQLGRKHGMRYHPLYRVWQGMLKRAYNKKYESWHRYGGRGIEVSHLWHIFTEFAHWAIANGWQKGLQIDRIDNNKGYYPENCRFVTRKENMRNQPRTRWVTIDGERMNTFDAAEKYEIVHSALIVRRLRKGWSDHDAVFTPNRKHGK